MIGMILDIFHDRMYGSPMELTCCMSSEHVGQMTFKIKRHY